MKPSKTIRWLSILSLLVASSWVVAESATPEPDSQSADIDQSALERGSATDQLSRQFHLNEPGLGGILVDRTMTMMGKTFYREFAQLAMQRPLLSEATLTFHERPDARWGSQLWITENSTVLYRAQLSPRLNESGRMAHQAVDIIEERLIEERLTSQLTSNEDLGEEEL